MKKILITILALSLLTSCASRCPINIKVRVGDTRTTETYEYIIVERCSGVDKLTGLPYWKFESITNKNTTPNSAVIKYDPQYDDK